METLPFILLALACPIGMGLMMLFMGKGMMAMGRGDKHDPSKEAPVLPADPEKRMALLQAQRQLLDAQIEAAQDSEAARASDETPR